MGRKPQVLHEEEHHRRQHDEGKAGDGHQFVLGAEAFVIDEHRRADADEQHQRKHAGGLGDHQRRARVAQRNAPVGFKQPGLDRLAAHRRGGRDVVVGLADHAHREHAREPASVDGHCWQHDVPAHRVGAEIQRINTQHRQHAAKADALDLLPQCAQGQC
jgi:hypothetical protein